ncbi:GntR family transcriptional regulator [Streptomyces sp. NPDC007264]|uniref:GntR family transcriptional regulator n=1 Tax=Streptomyces sp. NPDC007264 TaxID=3364777 RepID=UPI0036DAAB96
MSESTEPALGLPPINGGERLHDRVATTIRDAILAGKLAPGSRLSVPELSRQLQVSRTPAREALFLLQAEGLVSVTPRRGAVVLSGKPADLVELFEYREGLEGMAARLAAQRMSDAEKDDLRAAFDAHANSVAASDVSGHLEHDRRFHEVFIAGSRNRRITEELARLRSQVTLLTAKMSAEEGALDHVVEAHRAIMDGILSGDGRRAEKAARVHVRAILDFYEHHGE